ncbi:MAG: hypothetical protein ACRDP1_04795 [Nocardioidaceae bacterium]
MNLTKRRTTACALSAITLATGAIAGVAASGSATASSSMHTLKFTAIQNQSHQFGRRAFASTDIDRRMGKLIGYDTVSCMFNGHAFVCNVGLSLKGGQMYARFTLGRSGTFAGRITGGGGAYLGVTGTLTGHSAQRSNRTSVTVHYML